MLEISNIKKDYILKDQKVSALKGVSMCFRRNEFVSILGPSGCGKTTLLNIIGGLDRYTSGDLIIEGKSTKEYKDKDWDNYRNHRVGFVFQSYNLIPHQTILENVELALTLSGIKPAERKARATEVLNKVGLGDKLKSKPNQLSGGQMQRVAIARALVNDPEIILADEPTGALDSKTSVQIMELLKEVSEDRLVIMVTHNPELANTYSSRIIKLLDGELVEDSRPYTSEESHKEIEEHRLNLEKNESTTCFKKTEKKKSMSFWTALSLSFKNILTKKARTILIAFAGSIGIIGIALILSISSGFSTYINRMQQDTLSTYPITIEAKSVDFTSVIMSMFLDDSLSSNVNHDKDAVYPKDMISQVINNVGNSLSSNDLNKFYHYTNEHYSDIEEYVSAIKYTYNINLEFYTNSGVNVQPNSNAVMQMITTYSLIFFQEKSKVEINKITNNPRYQYEIVATPETDYAFMDEYANLAQIKYELQTYGKKEMSTIEITGLAFTLLGLDPSSMGSGGGSMSMMSSMFGNGMTIFSEMLDNPKLIEEQYILVGENSKMPANANEALLVLDKNNEIDEYVLYALGLLSDDQMEDMMRAIVKGNKLKIKIDYDSIIGTEYKILDDTDYYVKLDDGSVVNINDFNDENSPLYDSTRTKYAMYFAQALMNCTNKVKITGIVRLKDNVDTGSLSTGVAYLNTLTTNMVGHYNNSIAVENNKLSKLSLDTPDSINIYVNSFESKSHIQDFINTYNAQAEQGEEISYTDMVGIIMSTVSTIITSITYVLIAFVSVSLIVSSIMIGIITYISVIERTKEIGVLRSIGASKRDVKRVFTAESFIIGLASGLFGILITLILTLPINLVLKLFTGIGGLANLPILAGIILIAISVLLTFIAGLFPAKVASKKDPVLALRTE